MNLQNIDCKPCSIAVHQNNEIFQPEVVSKPQRKAF